MSVSEAPWDGSASNYSDTPAYCDACLVNDNSGPRSGWTQDKCHLPVKTPAGAISRNGAHNAASRINQLKGVSAASKASAKRKLASIYRNDLKEDPPDVLTA
jgi:hypothetical protein